MLHLVYAFRNELAAFVAQKGFDVRKLSAWLSVLAFLVAISKHMNVLNIKLQGRDQLSNKLFEHICAFEVKLHLWEGRLKQCNNAHFPTLSASQPIEAPTYDNFVGLLREQFNPPFADVRANNQDFVLLATPFAVNVDSVVVHLQMELIDL